MSAPSTASCSTTRQETQTVNSFSLCLEGFQQVLRAEQPIPLIEGKIFSELERPVRLLRWAIVKVETQPHGSQNFWCEGAYLKSCQ